MIKYFSKISFYQITLLFLGILFFILNYYTPFQHDDYAYAFNYDANSAIERPTNIPISDLSDILTSQYWHYLCVNGRFFTHIIVQLFCGLLGKGIFNIISSIIFICGINLIVKYINCNYINKSILAVLFFTCLLIFIPDFGLTFLWISGAINYMWASFATLFLILILNKAISNKKIQYFPYLIFLLSLFFSWMQESVSVGLGCVSFIYLIKYRHDLTKTSIYLISGIIIGSALLIFSPANFIRISSEGITTTAENSTIIQLIFSRIHLFIIFILNQHAVLLFIISIIVLRILKRKLYTTFINENRTLILIIIFNSLFIFALGKPDARIGTGITLFSIILLLKLILYFSIYLNKYLRYLIVFVFILKGTNTYINAVNQVYNYNVYKTEQTNKLINAPHEAIIERSHYNKGQTFVYYCDFAPDKYNFHNKPRAKYYDKSYMQSLPTEIYSRYKNGDLLSETKHLNYISCDTISVIDIYSLPDNSYWIIPIEKKFDNLQNKELKITGYDSTSINTHLTQKQKILNTLFGFTYNQPQTVTGFILSINNNSYLIFPGLPSTNKIEFALNDENKTQAFKLKK